MRRRDAAAAANSGMPAARAAAEALSKAESASTGERERPRVGGPPATPADVLQRAQPALQAPRALAPAPMAPAAPAAAPSPMTSGTGAEMSRQLAAAAGQRPPSLPLLIARPDLADADRGLLQQLDGLAQGRWRRGSAAALGQQTAPVREWPAAIGGGSVSLRIEAEGVTWTEPDGSRFTAALSADAVARLRSLL